MSRMSKAEREKWEQEAKKEEAVTGAFFYDYAKIENASETTKKLNELLLGLGFIMETIGRNNTGYTECCHLNYTKGEERVILHTHEPFRRIS